MDNKNQRTILHEDEKEVLGWESQQEEEGGLSKEDQYNTHIYQFIMMISFVMNHKHILIKKGREKMMK